MQGGLSAGFGKAGRDPPGPRPGEGQAGAPGFDRMGREARMREPRHGIPIQPPCPNRGICTMTYRIAGLPAAEFADLFALDPAALAARGGRRVTADADAGYPCRVALADARAGDELILLNYVSHASEGPFRTSYAIYVARDAQEPEPFVDAVPDYLSRRTLGLRGFDAAGMLADARLAMPGEADAMIRSLFANPAVAEIHAHNAAQGCFLARVEREGGAPR
jgi:hypothetical protein